MNAQELKTSCLNNEALVCRQLRVTKATSERKASTLEITNLGKALLNRVEEGIHFEHQEAYPVARLLKECHLSLPVTELIQPGPRANDFDSFLELRQRVETNRQTQQRLFGQTLNSLTDRVQRIVQEIRRSQVQINPASVVPVGVLDTMDAMSALPTVNDLCQPIHNKMQELESQITTIEEDIKEPDDPSDEEVQACEQQLTIRASLIDFVWEELGLLDKLEESVRPYCNVHTLLEKARREIQPLCDAKQRLKVKCSEDLAAVADEMHRTKFGNDQGIQRFKASCTRSDNILQTNLQKQDMCWREIQELESRLQLLGEQRYEEVERRIELIIAEAKRKADVQQQLAGLTHHKQLIDNTLFNCNVALDICTILEDLVDEACTAIHHSAGTLLNDVDIARISTHQRYVEYFRLHCHVLPLLINFNEINLEKIYSAMNTDYQFIYLYRERRAENERDLSQLTAEQKEEYERFKSCMNYLTLHNVQFVNPAEQLGPPTNAVEQRRYNVDKYRIQFILRTDIHEEDIDEVRDKLEEQYGAITEERLPELLAALKDAHNDVNMDALVVAGGRGTDSPPPPHHHHHNHPHDREERERPHSAFSTTTIQHTTQKQLKRHHTSQMSSSHPSPPTNSWMLSNGNSPENSPSKSITSTSIIQYSNNSPTRTPDHPSVARRSALSTRQVGSSGVKSSSLLR